MSDDTAINIVIPQGPRAALVRSVHERHKNRALAVIDPQIAAATDPARLARLRAEKRRITNQTVQDFIVRHFKAAAQAEEIKFTGEEARATAQLAIQAAIEAKLDEIKDL